MKNNFYILIMLIFFVVRGLVLSSSIPLWQSADEFAHYGYIQSLIEEGNLPNLSTAKLSKEIAESIFQCEVYKIISGETKVYDGTIDFECEGFKKEGNDGYVSRSYYGAGTSLSSLEIGYRFLDGIPGKIGIKTKLKRPQILEGVSFYLEGDGSTIPITVILYKEQVAVASLKKVVNFKGWKKLYFKTNRADSSPNNEYIDSIFIGLNYIPQELKLDNYNGKVHIDDISIGILINNEKKSFFINFEPYKLRHEKSGWWNQVTQHPPLYYFLSSMIYLLLRHQDILTIAFGIRIFSVVLGALNLYLCYLISKEIFKNNRYLILMIPAFMLLSGSFAYQSSVISNDNLVNLLFTVFLYLIVKKFKDLHNSRYTIWLAVISGLGLITKMTFMPAIIGIPILWSYMLRKKSWKKLVTELILISFLIVSISGWWYCRNYMMYGSIFTIATQIKQDTRLNTLNNLKSVWDIIIDEDILRWFLLSWLQISTNDYIEYTYCSIYLLSFFGWCVIIFRHFKSKNDDLTKIFSVIKMFLIVLALYFGAFIYLVVGSAIFSGVIRGIHGRYFHPLMVIFSTLVIFGFDGLLKERFKKYSYLILFLVLLILNHWDLFFECLVWFYV
jgi:hypothetical protein